MSEDERAMVLVINREDADGTTVLSNLDHLSILVIDDAFLGQGAPRQAEEVVQGYLEEAIDKDLSPNSRLGFVLTKELQRILRAAGSNKQLDELNPEWSVEPATPSVG